MRVKNSAFSFMNQCSQPSKRKYLRLEKDWLYLDNNVVAVIDDPLIVGKGFDMAIACAAFSIRQDTKKVGGSLRSSKSLRSLRSVFSMR